jgi:HD superfamily phosphohydrolase
MRRSSDFEVVRDPVWNNIRIDAEALAILDSEPLQRLRYVRQLGHAFLVYPGATHSRFEHALGAYHLARRALGLLRERGELNDIDPDEPVLVTLAALLHDVGHYPFSHALEEAGLPSHEALAAQRITDSEIGAILDGTGIAQVQRRIVDLITGTSGSPLQGLISGSLDLDKIEYLTRDARMCGVPYGTVDVDRLLHSITLVASRQGGYTTAVHEKGVSALESLLFSKYQMYRNVYWHHAVRSATAMFKRLVRRAIARGTLTADWIAQSTDEALMERLDALRDTSLAQRLRRRKLYKRAVDDSAADLEAGAGEWIHADPDLLEQVEDALAADLGLDAGEILLDFPTKPAMLKADLPLLTRSGVVDSLGEGETASGLGLHRVADELHNSARRFRAFVARPVELDSRSLLSLVARTASEVRAELERGTSLLATTR